MPASIANPLLYPAQQCAFARMTGSEGITAFKTWAFQGWRVLHMPAFARMKTIADEGTIGGDSRGALIT